MLRPVYLALLFLLFFSNRSVAQGDAKLPGFGIEANFLTGRIIKHTAKFKDPLPPFSSAVDLNFVWQTYGKKDWHEQRKFPLIGIGVSYVDYGNDALFGKCIGVYPNIQIMLLRGEKFEWTLRVGDGLGYVTKKHQTGMPLDTANTAIGSYLNDFGIFMTDIRYRVDQHWDLQLGGNWVHISNGDYHSPNLGINFPGAHIGVRYFPGTSQPDKILRQPKEFKNKWMVQMRAAVAYNEENAPDSPVVASYLGSVYVSKLYRNKNKLFGGIDFAYHQNIYDWLVWTYRAKGHEFSNSSDGAIFIGNEFLLGRLGVVTQLGYYYHQIFAGVSFQPFYEKIGGNLYLVRRDEGFIKEFFVYGLLLTHSFQAQLAEFGLGVGFNSFTSGRNK